MISRLEYLAYIFTYILYVLKKDKIFMMLNMKWSLDNKAKEIASVLGTLICNNHFLNIIIEFIFIQI